LERLMILGESRFARPRCSGFADRSSPRRRGDGSAALRIALARGPSARESVSQRQSVAKWHLVTRLLDYRVRGPVLLGLGVRILSGLWGSSSTA
jgi:hypothetical protein